MSLRPAMAMAWWLDPVHYITTQYTTVHDNTIYAILHNTRQTQTIQKTTIHTKEYNKIQYNREVNCLHPLLVCRDPLEEHMKLFPQEGL